MLTKLLLLLGLIDGDIDMSEDLKKHYLHVHNSIYCVCVSICTCAYVLMLASKVRDC